MNSSMLYNGDAKVRLRNAEFQVWERRGDYGQIICANKHEHGKVYEFHPGPFTGCYSAQLIDDAIASEMAA